jgi:TRL-like protein family
MKKSRLLSLAAALSLAGAIACGSAPLSPPGSGSLYTNVKANFNCWHGDEGSCVGENGPKAAGSKSGEACASTILMLITTGDMSLKTAASNGGISRVASIDYSTMNVLGSLYMKSCTIVNGE